jgi:hypothetical protein
MFIRKLEMVNNLISERKSFNNKQYRQYSLGVLGSAILPLLAIGMINYVIDPYGLFQTPKIEKFNLLKPAQDDQTRLFKSVEIINLRPQRVLLGSSRAILGLDPSHGAFNDNLVTYNLGLTGPNIRDIRQYFEHSLTNQPDIKQVVLSLDFFMFKQPDTLPGKPDNNILGKQQIPIGELVRLILSLDSLKSSQKTLEDNLKSNLTEPYYFDGMRRDTYSSKDKMKDFQSQILNYFNSFYKDYRLSSELLQELKDIIALCRKKNIDLQVFISPIHATQMEAIERAGLWKNFENWKREVNKITSFWDFATYNSVTNEPIKNSMKNFHDSAHYTKRVGDLVLNRIFSYQLEKVPRDFGVFVSSQNLEYNLNQFYLNKRKWEQANPQYVKMVNGIYQQSKP